MTAAGENRVRALREARGLSQTALAAAAKVSRQSVFAIEAGRASPSVDVALRLAAALDATVEELFASRGASEALRAEVVSPRISERVALAQIAGRWVAHDLSSRGVLASADGLVARRERGHCLVTSLRTEAEARDNVLVMGCATALGLLADRLSARSGAGRFRWIPASSTRALDALASSRVHVSGVHLVDGRSGEANVVDVRKHAGAEPLVITTLARWEAGLVVAAGNPKKLRGAKDLGRRGLRLVSREPGSGARRLLDRALREAEVSEAIARDALCAEGHLEVAQTVALGAADVGIATRDVAIAFGLDFLPLAEERYDLVATRSMMQDARVQRLFDVMTSGAARGELESLGYDVRSCGAHVADVQAA